MKINTALPIYFIALVLCSSRGILEFFTPKTFAYAIQFGALVAAAACLSATQKKVHKADFIILIAAIFIAVIATAITIASDGMPIIATLLVTGVNILNLYFLFLAITIARQIAIPTSIAESVNKKVALICIGTTMWIVGFSGAQYLGYIEFQGAYGFLDTTRLSGAFGSMQHLSIALSILAILNLCISINKPKIINILAFLLALGTLVVAFTRIGYFIFAISFGLYSFASLLKRDSFAIKRVLLPAGMLLFVALLYAIVFHGDVLELFYLRLLSIDVSETSNIDRLRHWQDGLIQYFEGPLFTSNVTGIASQIPNIVLSVDSFHYESGQLQYLVNFGIFFWMIVAYMFWIWLKLLPSQSPTKFLPAAAWLALYIYMFNEIVPVFVLFPLVSLVAKTNSKKP